MEFLGLTNGEWTDVGISALIVVAAVVIGRVLQNGGRERVVEQVSAPASMLPDLNSSILDREGGAGVEAAPAVVEGPAIRGGVVDSPWSQKRSENRTCPVSPPKLRGP